MKKKSPAKNAAKKTAKKNKPAAKKQSQATAAARQVKFLLRADTAGEVVLVGSFNAWNPAKGGMKQNKDGIWTKTLRLKPGAYEYKFLVDGQWWSDPDNPDFRDNEFGTTNSVVTVPGQDS